MRGQKPSLSHPKGENLAPPSVFGLNTAIPSFKGGAKGLELSHPRPSSLTVFGLNRGVAPSKRGVKGARTFAPPAELTNSFWLEQTFLRRRGGAKGARSSRPGRAHRADSRHPGLTEERPPPAPFGVPVAMRGKARQKPSLSHPKGENLAPPSVFGLNTAIPGFKGGAKGLELSRPRTIRSPFLVTLDRQLDLPEVGRSRLGADLVTE